MNYNEIRQSLVSLGLNGDFVYSLNPYNLITIAKILSLI